MIIQRRIFSLREKIWHFFNLKINTIVYFPEIINERELIYHINTIASTIPFRDELTVKLMVDESLLNVSFDSLQIPNFQGDFIRNRNLRHIKLIKYSFLELLKSDLICITNSNSYRNLFLLFSFKIQVLDSSRGSMHVPEFYKKINWRLNTKQKNMANIHNSKIALKNLLKKNIGSKNALVIAGGPSLKRFDEVDFTTFDLIISVNDFVITNLDFLKKSHPDILCFSDSTLFFGASEFTKNFYKKLQDAFNIKPFYIIVDIKSYDIVLQNGNFSNYLIGLERKALKNFKLISSQDLMTSTLPSANILTSFAMIVGLSIVDEIILFGVDGLEKNHEKIMNNKNKSSHRSSAYENYNAELPGFYRTYESAVENHNQYNLNLKKTIEFAKDNDKKVYTLYKSNYDCLTNLIC
jgi:hypothetical protein